MAVDLFPYVTAAKAGLKTIVSPEVKALLAESAALDVTIAQSPTHPQVTKLTTRKTAITSAISSHE